MKKSLKALSLVSLASLTLAQAPVVLAEEAANNGGAPIEQPQDDDTIVDDNDVEKKDDVVEDGDGKQQEKEEEDDTNDDGGDDKESESEDNEDDGDDDEKEPGSEDDQDDSDDEDEDEVDPWEDVEEDDIASYPELGDMIQFAQRNISDDVNIYIRYNDELEVYEAIIEEDGEGIVVLLDEVVENIHEEALSYSSYEAAEQGAKTAILHSDEDNGFNAYEIIELENGSFTFVLHKVDVSDQDDDDKKDDDKDKGEQDDVNNKDDNKDDEDDEDDVEEEENNVNGYKSEDAAIKAAEKALEENDNFSAYRISKRDGKYFFTLGNNLPEDDKKEDDVEESEEDITKRQEENYQANVDGFDSEEDAIAAAEQALKDNDNLKGYRIVKGEDGKYRFVGYFNELEDDKKSDVVEKETAVEKKAGSKEEALPETGEVSSFAAIGAGLVSALSGVALFFGRKRD